MTQEDKELLLQDLCARLSCKLHCCVFKLRDIKENDDILYGVIGDNVITLKSDKDECLMYYQIKPYLRPMSSMTEEEKKEDRKLWDIVTTTRNDLHYLYTDFLVSHHFDYRGLIPIGLALEAPEGMYKVN